MKITTKFILLFVLFAGCGENEKACDNSGEFIEEVNDEQASLHFDDQYEAYYIRYHLPGTIDSNYRGYICTDAFPDFLFTEGMTVNYSGKFYDTNAYGDVLIATGGETITVLELEFLAVP